MRDEDIARQGDTFKAKVSEIFDFLKADYGFLGPTDVGGGFRHSLAYRCPERNLAVVFTNAFHPVDYGFEITLNEANPPWPVASRHVIYYVLKEDQDESFEFLKAGRAVLRRALAGG